MPRIARKPERDIFIVLIRLNARIEKGSWLRTSLMRIHSETKVICSRSIAVKPRAVRGQRR